jgi:hypothetical protein
MFYAERQALTKGKKEVFLQYKISCELSSLPC